MKVAVLGAGAVGSMFGGLIKHHDPQTQVTLLARGEHGRAMSAQGFVTLQGPWGTHRPRVDVSAEASDLAGSDFVLLTVKSQDTLAAIESALPYLGQAIVVSIQNGLNQRILGRLLPPQRVVMGVTATNMLLCEPGVVRLQLDGTTMLGVEGDAAPCLDAACELLRRTGMRFDAAEDILGYQCNKLAINAIGYAACLSASDLVSEALTDPLWRERIGLPVLTECLHAFDKAGVSIRAIPKAPAAARIGWFIRQLNKPLLGPLLSFAARRLYGRPVRFSLGQDLQRGKKTEVDFINGEIVRMAQEHGGAAECNAKVVDCVHRLEERGDGSFYSLRQIVEEFAPPPREVDR